MEKIIYICMFLSLFLQNYDVKEIQTTMMESEKPKIALTFDDGPSIYTEKLLDGLEKRNVKATFFVIGKSAEVFPEIVKREGMEGHLVGNHTYNHVEISKLNIEEARYEIEKTNEILENLTHKKIEYVRPPFGIWEEELNDLDMISVMWSIDTLDWTTENVDEIVNKVVTQVEENDIILMHDCYESTVEATFRIIDLLKSQGYEFVTVEKLLIR